ncbi:hypothetical protein ACIBBE_13375 [Streptomyces sp. NPDC051644]|uniref:hypothetical protein n=1 Tax=Streptomyces sp. NPDC051644 TaxID=3365666 RepID=UPI0037B8A376
MNAKPDGPGTPSPSGNARIGADEEPEVPTHVSLHADGVLHLRGDLEVATPEGPRQETRVMPCGCGRTGNTPYCDYSGVCGEHK